MSEDILEMLSFCTPYCRWCVFSGMAQYLFISGQHFFIAQTSHPFLSGENEYGIRKGDRRQ